jgi:hypothetical protein
MADIRFCEKLATQASTSLGINNDKYAPWKNTHYVQWCVSEVQGERKFAVQLSIVIYDK